MANDSGYAIIRGAIQLEDAQLMATAMERGLKAKVIQGKYTEFEVPTIANNICDRFVKANTLVLVDFASSIDPQKPKDVSIGIFQPTSPDPKIYTAGKGEVYVTIALTKLTADTGWFIFLEGHPSNSSKTYLNLDAGDAVIWQGDLAYRHSVGGGGKFETIVYQI